MIHGFFNIVCLGPDGRVCWRQRANNLWTYEGMNDVLNQYFGGTALVSAYVGLISSVNFSALTANDTAAQINGTNGWTEAGNGTYLPTYSQSSRPALTLAAASGGSRAPSAASVFSITSSGTVKGALVIADPTIQGTVGPLIAMALFNEGDQAVSNGQTLNVSYTVSM